MSMNKDGKFAVRVTWKSGNKTYVAKSCPEESMVSCKCARWEGDYASAMSRVWAQRARFKKSLVPDYGKVSLVRVGVVKNRSKKCDSNTPSIGDVEDALDRIQRGGIHYFDNQGGQFQSDVELLRRGFFGSTT